MVTLSLTGHFKFSQRNRNLAEKLSQLETILFGRSQSCPTGKHANKGSLPCVTN